MGDSLLNETLVRELAGAPDYREFLRRILVAWEKARGRGARALLSRRAGFASRSYLTEVLGGKKGLSRDAMKRLREALKLSGPLARLFECLVALEHTETQLRPLDPAGLRARLGALRLELQGFSRAQRKIAVPHLRAPEVFQVYAALGTEAGGASLAEVCSRTGLGERAAQVGLKRLLESGAAVAREGRYYAFASKADALRLDDAAAVSEMVQKVCAGIQRNRHQIVADERSLNAYSAFSVRSERLAELKKSLEAAVFEVLDEFQDDSGDCVEQVFVSLFGKPLVAQATG